jgi:hypothetical protein
MNLPVQAASIIRPHQSTIGKFLAPRRGEVNAAAWISSRTGRTPELVRPATARAVVPTPATQCDPCPASPGGCDYFGNMIWPYIAANC